MARTPFQSAAAAVLFMVAASAVYAQTETAAHDSHTHHGVRGLCGTFVMNNGRYQEALANTARRNPDLYRRMMERTKRTERRLTAAAASDLIDVFSVRNGQTEQFDEVEAKLMYMGRRTRIWVDVRDTTFVRKATLDTLARGLDSATSAASRNPAKGIIENDEEVFGGPPVNRYDSETPFVEDFLLTDIQNSIAEGDVLGFFSPLDQTNDPGSNQMNILYIDTRPGLGNQGRTALNSVLSTLAHEYQHLIHYNMHRESEIFFNEGCSELASTLCGYFDRQNPDFLSNTNVPLLRWIHEDPLDDYQRSLTFMRYLYEQLGEQFITEFTKFQEDEMVRVGGALMAIGQPADRWKELLKGFAVANYLQRNFPDLRYIYQRGLSNSTSRVHNSYANEVPASGSLAVEQYATFYNLYSFPTPSGVKVKFDAPRPFAVMAVLFRNGLPEEVRELAPGVEHTLAGAGYGKIVFAVINLDYGTQTVRWTASRMASGVDDAGDAGTTLALSTVAANPPGGAMHMVYHLPGSGLVRAELLDMQGRRVRTILEGVLREEGEHTERIDTDGLSVGAYLIRLTHGGRSVARKMLVVR